MEKADIRPPRQRTESGTKRTNNLVTKRPPRPAQTNEEVYRTRRAWYHTHRERVALPGGLVVVVEEGGKDNGVNGGGDGQQQRPLPMLFLLVFCTVFGMCTWFSAGAVLPQLKVLYGIDEMMGVSFVCCLFALFCSLLLLLCFFETNLLVLLLFVLFVLLVLLVLLVFFLSSFVSFPLPLLSCVSNCTLTSIFFSSFFSALLLFFLFFLFFLFLLSLLFSSSFFIFISGSMLTLSVNFGFLLGALASVFFALADRYPPSTLMAVGSMIAGGFLIVLTVSTMKYLYTPLLHIY